MSKKSTAMSKNFKFPIWGWFFVFFGVIFVADGFLIYFANTSFTGVSSKTAYEEGLNYNDELARKKRQEDEGWHFDMHFDEGKSTRLRVALSSELYTAEDIAKDEPEIVATFYRPTSQGHDVTVPLYTSTDGVYQTEPFTLPLKGIWDVQLKMNFGGHMYKYQQRITAQN